MTNFPVMNLLASRVPLTLLLDLADPAGPDSTAINSVERPPGDPIWLESADQHAWREFILRCG
jgi:hypothetical protein